MKHVVFDLETYSLEKNALILSAGFALFEWEQLHEFETYRDTGLFLKLDPSAQKRRHIDIETMEWWDLVPCAEAKEASLCSNPVGLAPQYFAQALKAWVHIQKLSEDTMWYCRGPHFDAAILEDFAGQYGLELPFGFWQVRDVRTFMDHFQKERLSSPDAFVAHHPLHDAAWDAQQMVYWSMQ